MLHCIPVDQNLSRMNKQMNEEEKLKLCNFIIENDEQQMLITQVLALHEKILQLSQTKP